MAVAVVSLGSASAAGAPDWTTALSRYGSRSPTRLMCRNVLPPTAAGVPATTPAEPNTGARSLPSNSSVSVAEVTRRWLLVLSENELSTMAKTRAPAGSAPRST